MDLFADRRGAVYFFRFFVLLILSGIVIIIPRKNQKAVYISRGDSRLSLLIRMIWLIPVAIIFLFTIYYPVGDWDGMSHWIMKSKVMYYYQGLNFEYTHHNVYPILWPLNVAVQFVLAGGMFDVPAKWTSGALFLVFFAQLVEGLRILNITLRKALPVAVLLILVAFQDIFKVYYMKNFINANAENIFLAFLTATVVMLLLWFRDGKLRSLVLAGVMSVGLGLAKFEGWVAVICILISLFMVRNKIREKWPLLIFLLGILLPLLWAVWIQTHGFLHNFSHYTDAPTLRKLIFLLKTEFLVSVRHNMTILFYASIVYMLLFGKKGPLIDSEKFLIVLSGLLIGFDCFVNISLTPEQISRGIPEAFPRLFLHAMPSYFLFWSSRCLIDSRGQNG